MIKIINDKIISKYSSHFLDYFENKYSNNQPYLNFLKSMIVRVENWEELSSEKFLLPAKRLIKKNNISDLLELINEKSDVNEKKLYGDVFTPFSIVNNMLDKLPKDIWSNLHLKWLDPANGLGNFPLIIIQRLMVGLKVHIKNEDDRYNHIVTNMLYMCDIQSNNNLFVSEFFQGNINIYTKSYLRNTFEKHMKNIWNVDKFDIVVCNPPYSIYDKFTEKSVSLLRDNGYLLQVNPASWRKPQSDRSRTKNMWNILTHDNHLQYLEIHSLRDGKKTFDENRRYDILLMKKTNDIKETIIIDEKGKKSEIKLTNYDFLPNYNLEKILKYLGKDCERILFSRTAYGQEKHHVSDDKSEYYKYPVVHYIKESGPEFKYSSKNDEGFFKIPKVIFAEKGLHNIIIDMGGEYGMTNHSFALKVKNYEEALKIKKFLLSNEFKDIIASCSWGSYSISFSKPPCFIDWRLFTYFKENFWNYRTES